MSTILCVYAYVYFVFSLFSGLFSFVDYLSVLWYCWLGLLTCKNRLPYNLYCVGGDVKHCSIQSNPMIVIKKEATCLHTYLFTRLDVKTGILQTAVGRASVINLLVLYDTELWAWVFLRQSKLPQRWRPWGRCVRSSQWRHWSRQIPSVRLLYRFIPQTKTTFCIFS